MDVFAMMCTASSTGGQTAEAAQSHIALQTDLVFAAFLPWRGWVRGGFDVDFIGQITSLSYFDCGKDDERWKDRLASTCYPPTNAEIFEWRSLLSAVLEARDSFVMIDAGAGYGRWLVACALAAKRRRLATRLIGIEAEPTHFAWLKEHIATNGIPATECQLIDAPLAGARRDVTFAAGRPVHWWGQAIVGSAAEAGDAEALAVTSVTLYEVLAPLPAVDVLDMDIQGAELEVVATSAAMLDDKIKNVHISTHSQVIEAELRNVFSRLGWTCIYDFAGQGKRCTPYGELDFVDGVQSWRNRKLR